jgi:integrase
MRGSIRKRGSTYTYWLDIGPDTVTGKRRQRTKGGFRTKRECQTALNEAISALTVGDTGAAIAADGGELPGGGVAPGGADGGAAGLDVGELPHERGEAPCARPGAIELQRLSPAQLNAFYRELLTKGRRNAAGGLAPKTVYYIHSILHRALRDAVRWGYVVRNVADVADPPKAKTPEMRVWSPAQLRAFLDHVRGDRLYAAWLLAATTGMRRGEILGLRWSDLDLDAGRVAVRRPRILVDYQVVVSEPKTAKGRRSLALDPVAVAALRAHRARQAEEKLAVGGRYRDSELVFTRPDGTAVHPERFSDWFRQRVRAAELPMIRLHDVRHSYATAALAAGVPAKVVSERLGHANIAITMDTYSHVLPGLDEQAAGQVARLILGGGSGDAS